MKERPILFSGPMVRAILEGRKTQTRRVVKRTKAPECDTLMVRPEAFGTGTEFFMDAANPVRGGTLQCNCPYGVPGDRLWVREAWSTDPCYDHIMPSRLRTEWPVYYDSGPGLVITLGFHRVRPSIHMPRWASRLTLEVASIRVERLQEISDGDAKAEGVSGIDEYAHLWDSINGVGAWALNPLVWVVEFKKMEGLTR